MQKTMSYQVIARKFRPQTFEEVIGQKHVSQTLKNAIRDERIAHAFLFTGERGVGKTSVARILAKALNCIDGPAVSSCGTCASCREITAGNCLDVSEIDGASNTGVDDIRALREHIRFLPSRDRYKIYIIDEVHMLSTSAFNALLKTLEEPPAHVIFMFATTEPRKIPDTIISRCLRFDFKKIPAKDIVEHLEHIARGENVTISRRGLFLIAREAEGSMRDAQTILERAISYCRGNVTDSDLEELLGHIDRQNIYRIMEAVLTGDPQGCIDGLNELYEFGVDIAQFYYSFLEHLRDLIMVKTLKNPSKLVDLSDEDFKKLENFSSRISPDELHRCFRLWFSSEAEITRSAFPKIALEVSLLEIIHLKKAASVDEILSKIDSLKKQIENSGVASSLTPLPFQSEKTQGKNFEKEKAPGGGAKESPRFQKDVEAFLSFVRKKHAPTASILAHGNIGINSDSTLKIEFPAGSFFIDKMKEVETRRKFAEICKEFFQKEIKLSIIATNAEGGLHDRAKKTPAKNLTQEHPLDNPVIQRIIKTFNGKIVTTGTNS